MVSISEFLELKNNYFTLFCKEDLELPSFMAAVFYVMFDLDGWDLNITSFLISKQISTVSLPCQRVDPRSETWVHIFKNSEFC